MPHRLSLLAAAVALMPAGAIAVAQADSGQHAGTTRTLSFIAQPTGGGQVDNPPKGLSPGDEFFEHGTIANTGGHRMGSYTLTTHLIAGTANHGTEQSTVIVFLARGQLVTTGGHATVERFSMAVVGGTGPYARARGP